jgi:hypothetical protein
MKVDVVMFMKRVVKGKSSARRRKDMEESVP